MNIKMIVTDMDGTLLNSKDELSEATCNALIRAQQKGIKLVLASGRSYRKLLNYAKRLQMDKYGGYLIEVNGMAVMNVASKERRIYHQLNQTDCNTIYQVLQNYEVEQQYMIDDGVYHYLPPTILTKKIAYREEHGLPKDYPLTASIFGYLYDNREGYPHIHSIQDISEINVPINKVCVYEEASKLEVIADTLKVSLKDKFWIGLVSPQWLEISPLGATKGQRLLELAKDCAIQPDEILCFGDGENDMEMLKSVPYGIAMGNALDSVKVIAYYVSKTNDEDGIVFALQKFNVL